MNDSAVESLFLHLLSAAIWDKEPDADRYAGLNEATWNSIIRLAKQQSSLALIADKVLALPEPSLPPRPMRISLYTFAEKVKATNLRMGEVLNTLSAKYAGMWFSFVTTIRRSIKFGDISPEHIRLLPYKKFFNRMRIGFGN